MQLARHVELGKYISYVVLGAQDGIVTTFAVVAGAMGAALPLGVILILGFANLFADGVSMATGNYLGAKSEVEYGTNQRRKEEWEVENNPEEGREEIRQIYLNKGLMGEDLECVVKAVTADKRVWVDTMMLEELRLVYEVKSPFWAALSCFMAFVAAGLTPLSPYVASLLYPSLNFDRLLVAVAVTLAALFIAGSLRALVTRRTWWKSGIEMTLIGGFAASVAYFTGYLLAWTAQIL